MAQRRLRKIDILQRDLTNPNLGIKEIKRIAAELKWDKDRFLARPAAELLVERGDVESTQLSTGLAATPVLGREPHGDLLRAAYKRAMASAGIPPEVETMARRFYAHRGEKWPPKQARSDDWIATSDSGGLMSSLRRLFGR